MVGRCRLCLEERELKRSHILPDFAGRWLKDTSATGYLRYSGAPNKRHQDTERLYLFCEPCEQRLSVWERKFRLEVFTKIVNDEPKPYRYGPWLLLFGVSVCWRAALLALEAGHDLSVLTPPERTLLSEAMERWRGFMLGLHETPGVYRVQMLALGVLAGFTGVKPPAGMNTYLARTLQTDILAFGERHGILAFAKIGPAVFVGFIRPPERAEQWKGTGLHVRRGEVPRDGGMPRSFYRYLEQQAARMVKAVRGDLSPRQHERIREAYQRNPQRVAQSDATRVLRADVEMFGDDFLLAKRPVRKRPAPRSSGSQGGQQAGPAHPPESN